MLIITFNVLLFGGIIWTIFWRNPSKLSRRQLVAIKATSAALADSAHKCCILPKQH